MGQMRDLCETQVHTVEYYSDTSRRLVDRSKPPVFCACYSQDHDVAMRSRIPSYVFDTINVD
jgi:hypothetical protein